MILGKKSKANAGDDSGKLEKTEGTAGTECGKPEDMVIADDSSCADDSGCADETNVISGDADEIADNPDDADHDPVAALMKDLDTERDRYLRLAAEYDNFRKRSSKEREMIYNDARADAITRLLPVYDNLERALKMECADEAFYKGVEMTMTGLTDILEGMNVKPIAALGEQFDPNRHNAVMSIEDPELGEKTIAEEYQKGFILGERVIRFSTVVVAN